MTLRRRTQVAKGEVCKTFIQRFESARRLHPSVTIITGSFPPIFNSGTSQSLRLFTKDGVRIASACHQKPCGLILANNIPPINGYETGPERMRWVLIATRCYPNFKLGTNGICFPEQGKSRSHRFHAFHLIEEELSDYSDNFFSFLRGKRIETFQHQNYSE